MTYEETMEYISGLSKFGVKLGLENMSALLDALDHPEKEQKIIHIAGTNGKGSTGAFIAAGLKAAGYKVGRYVSPSVFGYEERFSVNGARMPQLTLPSYIAHIKRVTEEAGICPTLFEVETAVALLFFKNTKCHYSLIEVGMGGRLDATNAVQDTLCSVITPISYDHTDVLGDTLAKIAYEKAGIIKQNGVVFSAIQPSEAAQVLKQTAQERGARLTFCEEPHIMQGGRFKYRQYEKFFTIKTKGRYQYQNAALAIDVLDYLINDVKTIKSGLLKAKWDGRFQVEEGDPVFIFDGAHNPQGAAALAESLKEYEHIIFICGIFADKDYKKMVALTAPLAEKVFTVTPPSPRGLDKTKLRREFLKYVPDVTATTLKKAIAQAMEYKGCCVAVFGSLSFLGEAIKEVKEKNLDLKHQKGDACKGEENG